MATDDTKEGGLVSRRLLIEGATGIVMLTLAFIAIASSDVSQARAQVFWTALVLLFGVIDFLSHWLYRKPWDDRPLGIIPIIAHWLGLFFAIELIQYFTAAGRIDNADIGLVNGVLLALATFLAGVHGNWRLIIVGTGIGVAAAGVALVEQYLWVLFGVVVVALIALMFGMRFSARNKADADAGV